MKETPSAGFLFESLQFLITRLLILIFLHVVVPSNIVLVSKYCVSIEIFLFSMYSRRCVALFDNDEFSGQSFRSAFLLIACFLWPMYKVVFFALNETIIF